MRRIDGQASVSGLRGLYRKILDKAIPGGASVELTLEEYTDVFWDAYEDRSDLTIDQLCDMYRFGLAGDALIFGRKLVVKQ
jgi:hypothetical protein